MPAVNRSAAGVRRDGGEQGRIGDAEADFLAFHVAARLHRAGLLINALQERVSFRFRPIRSCDAAQEQNRHGGPHCPPVLGRFRYFPQRVREAGWDRKNRQQLKVVAEWGGIFKRMGAVGVEESTTVCAQHLDGFLRSHRALCDRLITDRVHQGLAICADHWLAIRAKLWHMLCLHQFRRVIGAEVLYDSLGHQQHGIDDAAWQQQPQRAAGKIYPEVSDGLVLGARDASDESHRQRDPHGG